MLPQRVTSTPSPSAAPSTITATPVPPILPSPTTAPSTSAPAPRLPAAPRTLALRANDDAGFTIGWAPGDDASVRYIVRLDGRPSGVVAATQATLGWPGGTDRVTVQVSALDSQGNEGPAAALVVVRPAAPREDAAPSATPEPAREPAIAPSSSAPVPAPATPTQPSPSGATQPAQPAPSSTSGGLQPAGPTR